ncbi:MAG TPA: recombinase family protein [Thermoanaerobacterales bacterium]|nr:recombinase family protein [Thermoanaerobacterales bacterium]
MARTITAIPPREDLGFNRKRVAAYARVSSGKDAMLHSLSAQVSYYSGMIQRRPDWIFAGVYSDEAVTGTKDSRVEFQRMLSDCEAGKIDMIITKSISRFARNTVTLLETVRRLKEINVDVYFEEQNIHSISGDGELMLTILASFSQAESLSVSENCKWRIRNKFKEGIPHTFSVLGYNNEHGKLTINKAEAEIVKFIFNEFLNGLGKTAIANKLNDMGYTTKKGVKWNSTKIDRILRNEKYAGDLMLQKVYNSDHLSKKKTVNNGDLPRYFISNNHEPIIERKVFEAVQMELERRSKIYKSRNTSVSYPLTGKIKCGICGKNYHHKINNAGTKYANPVWICSTYNTRGKKHCPSKQIPVNILEEIIKKFDNEPIEITAYPKNRLKFAFKDNTELETTWRDKSRKWTDEMKEKNYHNLRKGQKT